MTAFQSCGLRFCNLLFETNNSALGAFLLSGKFPSYRKRPHRKSKSGLVYKALTPPLSLPSLIGISMPSLVKSGLSVLEL